MAKSIVDGSASSSSSTSAISHARSIEATAFSFTASKGQPWEQINKEIIDNTALTSIDLNLANISNRELIELSKILPLFKELRILNLSNNESGVSGAEAIAKALVSLPKLTSFSFGGHQLSTCHGIGNSGAIAIAEALPHLTALTSLNLSSYCPNTEEYGIGDKGAVEIAKALPSLPSLSEVSFYGNLHIHEEGITAIAEAIPSLPHLRLLDLFMTDRGVWWSTGIHVDYDAKLFHKPLFEAVINYPRPLTCHYNTRTMLGDEFQLYRDAKKFTTLKSSNSPICYSTDELVTFYSQAKTTIAAGVGSYQTEILQQFIRFGEPLVKPAYYYELMKSNPVLAQFPPGIIPLILSFYYNPPLVEDITESCSSNIGTCEDIPPIGVSIGDIEES